MPVPRVASEMALHVLARNLTCVMNIMGVRPLMAAMTALMPQSISPVPSPPIPSLASRIAWLATSRCCRTSWPTSRSLPRRLEPLRDDGKDVRPRGPSGRCRLHTSSSYRFWRLQGWQRRRHWQKRFPITTTSTGHLLPTTPPASRSVSALLRTAEGLGCNSALG